MFYYGYYFHEINFGCFNLMTSLATYFIHQFSEQLMLMSTGNPLSTSQGNIQQGFRLLGQDSHLCQSV